MHQIAMRLWPQRFFRLVLLALLVSTVAMVQYLHLRAISMYSGEESHYQGPVNYVVNDGLVWITPKPNTARKVGWEDDWMMEWKRKQYSPDQRVGCNATYDTPYDDHLLCTIPGYVPARLWVPSRGKEQPPIPRVIFISWLERRLGRAMYTSLLTLLHHNPEYEFVLFTDEDVDRFICENVDDFIPSFSKVKAGAMRADIWRLLIIQRYGGVYLDSDVSSLNKLPIEWKDTAVSGVGCWSHLPGKTGGLLEHWAMAFQPSHPFVNKAVAVLKDNLKHPDYLTREDTPEAEAEGSVTMRLTGPAMYQWTLHTILSESKCRTMENSYCDAMWDPEKYCEDMDAFRSFFPVGLRLFRNLNLENAISHKLLYPAHPWEKETSGFQDDYDDPNQRVMKEPAPDFCGAGAFAERAASRESIWERKVETND